MVAGSFFFFFLPLLSPRLHFSASTAQEKKKEEQKLFSFLKKKFEKRETEKVVRGESNDYHKDRSCGLWLIPCCPPPSFKSLAFGTQELNVALGFTWWIQSTDIDLPLSCSLTELFNRNNLASLEGRTPSDSGEPTTEPLGGKLQLPRPVTPAWTGSCSLSQAFSL